MCHWDLKREKYKNKNKFYSVNVVIFHQSTIPKLVFDNKKSELGGNWYEFVEGRIVITRSQIFNKRIEDNFNLSSFETFHKGVVNKLN